MANTRVEAVMSSEVVTFAADASLAQAVAVIEETGHTVFPVADPDVQLRGIIAWSDLMGDDVLVAANVTDLARRDVVTIPRHVTVGDASRLMIAEGVDHPPVVDEAGLLVGMCTRTDILKAAVPALAAESREKGWLSGYRLRPK